MKLEELTVYKMAMDIGERVWQMVDPWNYFEKDTISKQLVKAVDSVAANISEGFGRYHYKETRLFGYYARGSLFETKAWLTKAYNRNLVSEEEYYQFDRDIKTIGVKLNNYIKSIGKS